MRLSTFTNFQENEWTYLLIKFSYIFEATDSSFLSFFHYYAIFKYNINFLIFVFDLLKSPQLRGEVNKFHFPVFFSFRLYALLHLPEQVSAFSDLDVKVFPQFLHTTSLVGFGSLVFWLFLTGSVCVSPFDGWTGSSSRRISVALTGADTATWTALVCISTSSGSSDLIFSKNAFWASWLRIRGSKGCLLLNSSIRESRLSGMEIVFLTVIGVHPTYWDVWRV